MSEPLRMVANREVSIQRAFDLCGYSVGGSGGKEYCPFGHIQHADGGTSKALRVYPETNSAYCFAGCGYLSPTLLGSMTWDCTEDEAAQRLLDLVGWVAPDYVSRWEDVVRERNEVDRDGLQAALNVFCTSQDPEWEKRRHEPEVAAVLQKCLGLLGLVRSSADARIWLTGAKTAMKKILDQEVRAI